MCYWIVEISKNLINFIYREGEKTKMATVQVLFNCFMMMNFDDLEKECQI